MDIYFVTFGAFLVGVMIPEFVSALGGGSARFQGFAANIVTGVGCACLAYGLF